MSKIGTHKGWIGAVAVVLVLALAAALGIGGCAASKSNDEGLSPRTTYAGVTTTAGATTTIVQPGEAGRDETSGGPPSRGAEASSPAPLQRIERASSEKVISDAQLEIEVETGKFQSVFDQALLSPIATEATWSVPAPRPAARRAPCRAAPSPSGCRPSPSAGRSAMPPSSARSRTGRSRPRT